MHNNRHRIQAFTIMEVTISMLVAAIVIGITYTSYTIISKSYLNFKTKNEQMAGLASLDQLLRRDFEQAGLITVNGNQILFKNNNKPFAGYLFIDSAIIRSSGITDTFKVAYTNCEALFEGQLKTNTNSPALSAPDNAGQHIDELSFTINFKEERIPYHYHKLYSSENLIKTDTDAIN